MRFLLSLLEVKFLFPDILPQNVPLVARHLLELTEQISLPKET